MRDLIDSSSVLALLERYDRPGPRYTSYPTAVEFHDGVGEEQYRGRLALVNAEAGQPLSAYAHLPFCEARCAFCGCNVVITRHRDVAAAYLDVLEKEIDLLAGELPDRRTIAQMHWGGGTPIGRPFVRNVCMVFDRYLRARTAGPQPVFSRTV